eukprot:TRINITY_DN66455_c0_g1_i1.p1 TRINITY_DN66455_c0_g1~~TRINITY_DN66455_c0_g1_i1.p1  ORF type:complete len:442 (-),score=63.48 TRINITY_DN66455_c0_g1_i1:98-1423(-)
MGRCKHACFCSYLTNFVFCLLFLLTEMGEDASRIAARCNTIRKIESNAADFGDCATAEQTMVARTAGMASRAKEGTQFSEEELEDTINSLKNLAPENMRMEWDGLQKLLLEIAHLSHKDWTRTGENSLRLAAFLLGDGMSSSAKQIFDRILHEGNWEAAGRHSSSTEASSPAWAVLVTGVNGIRKTTAMYQPWFPQLLQEALVTPPGAKENLPLEVLPSGNNSFFRQLDHIIATVCNEDFVKLYALTGAQTSDASSPPSKDLVQRYSDLKASIFTRFRTLSELVGVMLLREAQKQKLNCMLETSGRDVAMFHYIDSFFPDGYSKLALHFTINDLSCAQQSVDERMVGEIKRGIEALNSADAFEVIYANAGGPYGSEVLPGVQADSDRVWNDDVVKNGVVGQDWYKATIAINAHPQEPWTAQAVRPDGSRGTLFTFGSPRVI